MYNRYYNNYMIFILYMYKYININKLIYKSKDYIEYDKLYKLIENYYNINNYIYYSNYDELKDHIINKLKINIKKDSINIDKDNIKNIFLEKKSNGIFSFDLSMIDNNLYDVIQNFIPNNKVLLYKIDDNYIIKYKKIDNKKILSDDNIINLKNNLNIIFYNDINKLFKFKNIHNILSIIDNNQFKKKILDNLLYTKFIKSNIYKNYYMNLNNEHLVNNYIHTLSLKDDEILFNFDWNKYININVNQIIFDKLYNIYNYIITYHITDYTNDYNKINFRNISNEVNVLNNISLPQFDDKIINIYNTNADILYEAKNIWQYIKSNDFIDLFNIDKIKIIFDNIKNIIKNNDIIYIYMNNIFSKSFKLIYKKSLTNSTYDITQKNFINNIIIFLNEIIKTMIFKLIDDASYNFLID